MATDTVKRRPQNAQLAVAVTGPTGDLGRALVPALLRSRRIARVVGMARRPFDPKSAGWQRFEYLQGDVADRDAVRELVRGADVVVHLAFAVLSASDATWEINVGGSRTVFEEAIEAGVRRIVYASSVAAYGFRPELPARIDEKQPALGSPEHPYSAQKAAVERALNALLETAGARTQAWVLRPCIIAGPRARTLIEELPYVRAARSLPGPLVRLARSAPLLRPVLPDPGVPFQLVHEDDVAQAFVAAVFGHGEPGPYNLAAPGTLTITRLAHELGWHAIPVPRAALIAGGEALRRLPGAPAELAWVHALRRPVLMRTERAQKLLGWKPRHTALRTLRATIAAARAAGTPLV
ncbi:NAD-dependent epimerase/dehydratase family protein [Thermoleophilum album]|uniref:NAD-dependent epimerase/dehydratase family protein n=1 Tax=Thermoleophilum album TaxID=29539 RepID=UPI00237CFD65|nr:NAD-dependent epimerase/dehydratase family protein [Thermoleophilum album]WDT93419.1 NAD-dependent epimerase/dehydratase family protein [Thermoleophilum album]